MRKYSFWLTGILAAVGIVGAMIACGGGGGGGANTFTVGGTVTGLSGEVVLQCNDSDDMALTGDGAFTFATALADGSGFSVTVLDQPAGQSCFITDGTGIIAGANITNVSVDCYDSGSQDSSFDGDGIVSYDSGADDRGYSIAIDDSGRILVTGYSGTGLSENMVIWRRNSDGSADTSFDTDGMVTYDFVTGGNANPDRGSSIILDAYGDIYASGWDFCIDCSGISSLLAWRYGEDGTMDPSFDPPLFHVNALAGYDRSVALDADGNILVTGYTVPTIPTKMLIVRYNISAEYDTSFNTNGWLNYNSANGSQGFSITVDADGKILVAGYIGNGSDNDLAIWRYNASGTLDTTFDTDGIALYNSGEWHDEEGRCMVIDANGKILVTGYLYDDNDDDMAIWRYNSSGTLDTSFGTGGVVRYDNGSDGYEQGYSITTDAFGRILVAGTIDNGTDNDIAVWRYNADGSPDTGFDTDGMVVYDSGNDEEGYSIAIDNDGKVLVTGGSNDDMIILRLIP